MICSKNPFPLSFPFPLLKLGRPAGRVLYILGFSPTYYLAIYGLPSQKPKQLLVVILSAVLIPPCKPPQQPTHRVPGVPPLTNATTRA